MLESVPSSSTKRASLTSPASQAVTSGDPLNSRSVSTLVDPDRAVVAGYVYPRIIRQGGVHGQAFGKAEPKEERVTMRCGGDSYLR
jgi:hypothetical protein